MVTFPTSRRPRRMLLIAPKILSNLALIVVSGFVYGLQRLLFGPLRPVEIEQLYEKGWFAITEWLFAMSTFRDEFGVWFLIMFVSLFVGKLWGWLAEGRIETLEQQPPANPRLFHTRLIASLTLYVVFAVQMFRYCFDTVFYDARPGVMVMFVFEFAIITISAFSTVLRYMLWGEEYRIIRKQTKERKEARKAAIRQAREQAQNQADDSNDQASAANAPKPLTEAEVDEEDIEVPGWEAKGSWLFALDIGTDFLKLAAYMAFFTILTVFYGIPIYIIRDMYLTLRSFTKRVSDYIRYQHATRDMHARYPDATAQELESNNTCIVCREEMRPWHAADAQARGAVDPLGHSVNERQRPKKLPCGHILHFGCLRSWLERQQTCPTCRRSVLATVQRPETGAAPGAQEPNNANPNNQRPPANRVRILQLGPVRFELRRWGADQEALRNLMNQLGQAPVNANDQPEAAAQQPAATATPTTSTAAVNLTPEQQIARSGLRSAVANWQLNQIEQQINQEAQALAEVRNRVHAVRGQLGGFDRLRNGTAQPTPPHGVPGPVYYPILQQLAASGMAGSGNMPLAAAGPGVQQSPVSGTVGQDQLPDGLVLPPGWTAIPLRPFTESAGSAAPVATATQPASSQPGESSSQPRPISSSSQPAPGQEEHLESSASDLFIPIPNGTSEANGQPVNPQPVSVPNIQTSAAAQSPSSPADPLSPQPVRPAPVTSNLDHAATSTTEADEPRGRKLGSTPNAPSSTPLGGESWSFRANGSTEHASSSQDDRERKVHQPSVEDGDEE